jgi:hypothetical protein
MQHLQRHLLYEPLQLASDGQDEPKSNEATNGGMKKSASQLNILDPPSH